MSGNFHNKGGYKHTKKSIEKYKKSFDEKRRSEYSALAIQSNKRRSPESRKKAGVSNSKTRKQNREKYIGINSPCYGIQRTQEQKIAISEGTKNAMANPTIREYLSKKAKERCTPEWRKSISINNKLKVCCIRCKTEMGKSSLGRHQSGRRCV
jgi:hypothetical protein